MKVLNKLLVLVASIVCLGTSFSCNKTTKIQLLATSDLHGMLVPFDYALDSETKNGSLSQIGTAIEKYRNNNTLVIDCGDIIQGNYAEIFKDEEVHPMIQALNLLNYDVFVTGNHEYNFNMERLQRNLKGFKGAVLTGNVVKKDTYEPLADSFKIFNKGGIRIGVVGMTNYLITKWDSANLEGWKVTDPIEETKKVVKNLKDNDLADVIVAVEHFGINRDEGGQGVSCADLANACPEIDVIIGGHQHEVVNTTVNNSLIVENKSNAQTMMKIDLEVNKVNNKNVVSKKTATALNIKEFETNAKINEFAKPFDERAKANAREPIGKLVNGPMAKPFEITKVPSTYMKPTPLVRLVNEVQLAVAKEECKEIADKIKVSSAAIGNYHSNLEKEEIRKCDCSNIYKYENYLYVLEMNGKQLKQYMEWAVTFLNQYKDKDLTISFSSKIPVFNYDMFAGVKYDVNISKEAGSRIENLKWEDNDTSVKEDDVFYIAVSHYRANSQLLNPGVIYPENERPKLYKSDLKQGQGIREMIVDYITEKKTIDADDHKYNVNNWEITGIEWDETKHKTAVDKINNNELDIGEFNTKTITEEDIK